jgi:hypothetical protein
MRSWVVFLAACAAAFGQASSAASFLAQAVEAARRFTSDLPNYLCRQQTVRYESYRSVRDFRRRDVVTCDLAYEGGREKYGQVRVNGRPPGPAADRSGAWSTGEYGTTLRYLLSHPSPASFRFLREELLNGSACGLFEFHVPQSRSRWRLQAGSFWLYVEHRGRIWIDAATGRVLRLEMESINLPSGFPLDQAEWMVEYGWVRIGDAEHLVPVRAASLACWPDGRCVKNETEFLAYRRFEVETKVFTATSDQSESTTDGYEPKFQARKLGGK